MCLEALLREDHVFDLYQGLTNSRSTFRWAWSIPRTRTTLSQGEATTGCGARHVSRVFRRICRTRTVSVPRKSEVTKTAIPSHR